MVFLAKEIILLHNCWFPGLRNLESLNLSFTAVTDGGMIKLAGLSSLKSLNVDNRQITDAGLAFLTSKHDHSQENIFIWKHELENAQPIYSL